MKTPILLSFLLVLVINSSSVAQYEYESSDEFPFGRYNPEAPDEIKEFQPLIGISKCKSINRKTDGTWNDEVDMLWKFKYIMNGFAVQDETLKADGKHSGSIRQFNADSSKWYVHYYSTNSAINSLPSWEGQKSGDSIVLYRKQKAPNGTDGHFRLTFYDINEYEFKWVGAWVSLDEKIIYPTWKIFCTKERE